MFRKLLLLLLLCSATLVLAQDPGDIVIIGNINSEAGLEDIVGVDFAKSTGNTYTGTHDYSGATVIFPNNQNMACAQIGGTTCICTSSDRLYHDTNCDGDKDGGEEFLDFTSGTSLTVRDIDGTPTVSNVSEFRFTNGTVTDSGSGVVTIAVTGSGEASPWADTDPVVLDTTTRKVEIGDTGGTTAKLNVDGTADEIQLNIRGHSSQSANLAEFETSAGTNVATLSNDGDLRLQSAQDIDGPGTAWSIDIAGNIFGETLTTDSHVIVRGANELRLYDSDNSHYVAIKPPLATSPNVTLILPTTDGDPGQVLSTNGTGTLSWATDQTGGGGGSTAHCRDKNINNPETFTVTGINGEFSPLFYFNEAATITRMRFYTIGAGTALAFTLYECTAGTNCEAPTLSSQGLNGATLTTATTSPVNDDTFTNASITAGNEIWIQVDKDNASTVGPIVLFFVSICYTVP